MVDVSDLTFAVILERVNWIRTALMTLMQGISYSWKLEFSGFNIAFRCTAYFTSATVSVSLPIPMESVLQW